MRLLLIRHGQTPNNVTRSLDTSFPGAALTGLGEQQAHAVSAALQGEDISAIYVSPLVRTHSTAEPLATALGLRPRVIPGLEEIGAGNLELRGDAAAIEAYAGCLLGWMQGNLDRRMPGGSTGHEFVERFEDAIGRIARHHGEHECVAVFSHGAAIRVYTAYSTRMAPADAATLTISNTGMSVLSRTPGGRWTLEAWHAEPVGGSALEGATGNDVTGNAPSDYTSGEG